MLAACSVPERAIDAPVAGMGVGKMTESVLVGSVLSAQFAVADHRALALPSQVSARAGDELVTAPSAAATASSRARWRAGSGRQRRSPRREIRAARTAMRALGTTTPPP